jgi:DNA-directed RNA polymerase subunit E'/Rpb7
VEGKMIVNLTDKVVVHPKDLSSHDQTNVILNYLYKKFANHCSEYGYIFKDTIEILSHGMGRIIPTYFNGHVQYNVNFKCKCFNPLPKSILTGVVSKSNVESLSIEIKIDGVIVAEFNVFKDPTSWRCQESEVDLKKLKIGDTVTVELIKKAFKPGDVYMKGIVRVVGSSNKEKRAKQAVKSVLTGQGGGISSTREENDIYNEYDEGEVTDDEDDEEDDDENDESGSEEIEAEVEDDEVVSLPEDEKEHDEPDIEEVPDEEDYDEDPIVLDDD